MCLNARYFATNRGVIKIIQIVIGFILTSLLCATWMGGPSCFYDGKFGSVSALNYIVLIINIVLLVLNLADIVSWNLERIYSIVGTVLFLIAAVVIAWHVLAKEDYRDFIVAVAALLGVQFILFLWDIKILQGDAAN